MFHYLPGRILHMRHFSSHVPTYLKSHLKSQISHSSATNITKTQNNQRHSYTVIIIRKMQISGHLVPKGAILYKVDISKCEIVREL